jgi:hypothetical protein
MKKNEKDIQYKILKSEACGHSIEYRMIKKETELEKAKIDEGLSAKEKKKARKERNEEFVPHEKEKFHSEGYREYKTPQNKEKLKQKLKSKERPKLPSKEDLEYPMAASEEMEKCIDNPDCGCQEKKKEMKKSSSFYIQKIQELRKAVSSMAENTPKIPNSQLKTGIQDSVQRNTPGATSGGAALADSMGMPSAQEMAKPLTQTSQPKQPEYKMDAPSFTGSNPSKSPYINLKNAGNTVDVHNFDLDKFKTQVTGQKDSQAQNIQDYTKANNAYNTEIKAGSNKFINDLASNKSATPIANPATPNIPMASPAANTPGLSPAATQQAQAAANPAAAPNAAGTSDAAASKPQSFGQAFKAAREARMGGTGSDTFEWNGKKYHSFSKDDFTQGQGAKYNPNKNNQIKDLSGGPGKGVVESGQISQKDFNQLRNADTKGVEDLSGGPGKGVVEQENYNRNQRGQAPMNQQQVSNKFPNLGMTEKQIQGQAPSVSITPKQQITGQPKMGATPSEGQLRDQGFNKNKLSSPGGPA